MNLNILGRSWKFKKIHRIWQNTKYKSMYEIQEVVWCYLFHIFTCFLWTHLSRSKPIIKRTFKCLKRWFGFWFQVSSSICEDLNKAYPRSKKKSALIDNWEITAYYKESEQSEALVNKHGSFQKQLGSLGGGSGTTPENLCNFYTLM